MKKFMQPGFGFEIIEDIRIDDKILCYRSYEFIIYRETSTDMLFVSCDGSFTIMNDPQTGMPLTYKVWQEKYQNKE